MRQRLSPTLLVITLLLAFQICSGEGSADAGRQPWNDGPPLSITRSNETVLVTWSQTVDAWRLLSISAFGYVVSNSVSNGFTNGLFRRAKTELVSQTNYRTNGTNIVVVLPLDPANRFFILRSNIASPPLPILDNSQFLRVKVPSSEP